mmetsp:Transcript_3825/g.9109  ORF Transcript_3825/g.9109 Transcript_3825/m.9109 type:complete len:507 (-) Transcript_3825:91-1611(-)
MRHGLALRSSKLLVESLLLLLDTPEGELLVALLKLLLLVRLLALGEVPRLLCPKLVLHRPLDLCLARLLLFLLLRLGLLLILLIRHIPRHLGLLLGRRRDHLRPVLGHNQGVCDEERIRLLLALEVLEAEAKAEDLARVKLVLVLLVEHKALLPDLVADTPPKLLVEVVEEVRLVLLDVLGRYLVHLVEGNAGLDGLLAEIEGGEQDLVVLRLVLPRVEEQGPGDRARAELVPEGDGRDVDGGHALVREVEGLLLDLGAVLEVKAPVGALHHGGKHHLHVVLVELHVLADLGHLLLDLVGELRHRHLLVLLVHEVEDLVNHLLLERRRPDLRRLLHRLQLPGRLDRQEVRDAVLHVGGLEPARVERLLPSLGKGPCVLLLGERAQALAPLAALDHLDDLVEVGLVLVRLVARQHVQPVREGLGELVGQLLGNLGLFGRGEHVHILLGEDQQHVRQLQLEQHGVEGEGLGEGDDIVLGAARDDRQGVARAPSLLLRVGVPPREELVA